MPRNPNTAQEEIRLMVRCAQLYYGSRDHEWSQADIAKKLAINTTRVSRLLRRAQKEGIVRVEIVPPRLQKLEFELIDRYNLKDAVVVPSEHGQQKEAIGKAAADYFRRIAKDNLKICLASGTTILKMIENLGTLDFTGHSIYPMCSESTLVLKDFYPTQLASFMMTKYRDPSKTTAYSYRLPVIPLEAEMSSHYKEIFKIIIQSQAIQSLKKEAKSADIFFLGISSLKKPSAGFDSFSRAYYVDIQELKKARIVGIINYQPFNASGRIISNKECNELHKYSDTMVMMRLEELREAANAFGKYVIALAGGRHKVDAIRGALKGRFFNVLITDADVAEALIN